MKIVVIGIGQSLRGDDGAGPEAVRRWKAKHTETAGRPEVRAELFELPGLGLLDLLEGADAAVIVDAVQSRAAPGTLLRLDPHDLASFSLDAGSAHGWGVAETLQLGLTLSPSLADCRITLIGIAAIQFDIGEGLSPQVEAGLAEAVEQIEKDVRSLL